MPKDKKKYKVKKKPHSSEDNIDNTNGNANNVDNKAGGGRFFGNRERRERTPEELREHLKLFLLLVTWIILLSGVYMVCIQLEFAYILPIYLILGTIFFFVWLIYNGGFKKFDFENIEKPEETSYEEFTAFINRLKERQRKAKYFLILFIPFFIVMLMDYTIMAWGERLAG